MKKIYLKGILLCLCLLAGINASAYDAEVDGVYYKFSGDNAIVTYLYYYSEKNKDAYSGSVNIPETVTYNDKTYRVTKIGESAFHYCSDLTSVTIGDNVTEIDYTACGYSGLTSVTIPASVTSIAGSAFCDCINLTSIKVDTGNPTFDSRNDCNAIIETATNTLISGCQNTVIPNSVTSIEYYAFHGCSNLTSIIIPASVTSIGSYSFNGCNGLTSIKVEEGNVKFDSRNDCNAIIATATNTLRFGCQNTTIPNSVTSIGYAAFMYCESLTSVTIPNSVKIIDTFAFANCSGLTTITIPNSVTTIQDKAFQDCNGLTTVVIGNCVTHIGYQTFRSCSSLTDIYCYAENVPQTDSYAFDDTPISFATLHVPASAIEQYKTTSPWSRFGTIVPLEGEEESFACIDGIYYNFYEDYAEVTYGDNAYSGVVVIPESVTHNGKTYGVTSIGEYAFSGCHDMTSVTIPESVTTIGECAFYYCDGLTTVTIPESVTTISDAAFTYCTNLTTVIIPESVTTINMYAFSYCYGLTSVTIPESVTTISTGAFNYCI